VTQALERIFIDDQYRARKLRHTLGALFMTVYLDGRFLPLEDAKISVLDRGFIYGDGVYELIPMN